MGEQPSISVSDVREKSTVQIILGDSYVIQSPASPPIQRFVQDRALMLAAIVLVWTIVWPAFGPPAKVRYEIDPSFVHLGDNVFNSAYCRTKLGDVPVQLFPSSLAYANFFDTYLMRSQSGIPRDAQLTGGDLWLYANEVDSTSPVTVSINGNAISYLNQFFRADDSCRRRHVRIPIPLSLLDEGENAVVLQVGQKVSSAPNSTYEDIEFDHLGVDLFFARALSIATVSRDRLAAVSMAGLAFLSTLTGPLLNKSFQSSGWRLFISTLCVACAVATVLIPF